MKQLSVLHVLEASNHGTGTARHLLDLVEHAPGLTHHVALPITSTSRGEPVSDLTASLLRGRGAFVHTLPMRRKVTHPDTVRARHQLRRLAAHVRPDVVHGHSAVGGALARLVGAVPAIYTPNGIHPSRAAAAVERTLARRTAAAIAVSAGEARVFIERLAFPRDRVHVVPNGIADTRDESSRPLPPLPVPAGAPVVGWIGRHARQKAPEILVAAAVEVCRHRPDVHVVMAGGGPQLERTRAQVDRLALADRVHVLGFVPDARRLIGRFDVLALPSRWEGAPYVPLEAMAERVPLVLSDCVGNADLVEPGRTGWRVPVDDPTALARAILAVLTDPSHTRGITEAAHAHFRREYHASRMAERTEAVYGSVLATRS